MDPLATPAEFIAAYPRETPRDDITELLAEATALVRDATSGDRYLVLAGTATPAHGPILAAMRDATLAQVQAWTRAGVDPLGDAPDTAAPVVVSESRTQGNRSESRSYDAAAVSAAAHQRRALAVGLAPRARRILAAAGLGNGQPSWR